MIEYPPCKKCRKSHGMGVENMGTGEITPLDICSDCLYGGTKYGCMNSEPEYPKVRLTIDDLEKMNNDDELILKTPETVVLEEEFGCNQSVRLWNPKLYDDEGNEIMCACGKSAEQITVGKESYLAMCNSCIQDYENEFINPGTHVFKRYPPLIPPKIGEKLYD